MLYPDTATQNSKLLEHEPLTEDYGEPLDGSYNSEANIDFFSSLGTEKKKPTRPERSDPDKV